MMYNTKNSLPISAFSNPPRPCSRTTATYPPSYRDRSCPSHSCNASGLWRMVTASCFPVATSYRLTSCFSSAQSIPIQARIAFSSSFSSNFILPTRSPETHRNPYSRVLEGQHLSMRLASSSGRIRKSPRNHRVVGELIRNPALRLLPLEFPTFPQAIVKKEKGPKRKKTTTAVPLLSSKLAIANRTIRGISLHYEFVYSSTRSAADFRNPSHQLAEQLFLNFIQRHASVLCHKQRISKHHIARQR